MFSQVPPVPASHTVETNELYAMHNEMYQCSVHTLLRKKSLVMIDKMAYFIIHTLSYQNQVITVAWQKPQICTDKLTTSTLTL